MTRCVALLALAGSDVVASACWRGPEGGGVGLLARFQVEQGILAAAPLFSARPPSKVSFEAPSTTFFDRLKVFFSAIDLENTLVAFNLCHQLYNRLQK